MTRIAVILGDRYGVGPELVAKMTSSFTPPESVALVVCGDPDVWTAARQVAGAGTFPVVATFAEAEAAWSFLPMPAPLPVASVPPPAATDLYVGPAGDDAAAGTREAPLRTVEAALARATSCGSSCVRV